MFWWHSNNFGSPQVILMAPKICSLYKNLKFACFEKDTFFKLFIGKRKYNLAYIVISISIIFFLYKNLNWLLFVSKFKFINWTKNITCSLAKLEAQSVNPFKSVDHNWVFMTFKNERLWFFIMYLQYRLDNC